MEELKQNMEKNLSSLKDRLVRIKAGRASLDMLEGITVDYYGSQTPLNQVATLSVPDARTIALAPWEKTMLGPIDKAIQNSNLGVHPTNDGHTIRVALPHLTEERRKEYTKLAKKELEESKIGLRNIRHKFLDKLKAAKKDGDIGEDEQKSQENQMQKVVENYTKQLEEMYSKKEKEILTI